MTDYFKSKNVLVTGGAGFIGTNLIKNLARLGSNITSTLYNKTPIKKERGVNYIKCDLTIPKDCLKICENVDFVFMCAANSSGAEVMAMKPLTHLTPNIIMNMNMLEAAYEKGVEKFLFISSNTVYPFSNFAVKEEDVTNEFYESYYIVAWMKRFTEIVCEMYSGKIKSPMKTIVVRPGNLYGPYDKFDRKKSKVIPALIRRSIERQNPFIVWGDGEDNKDFLYIDDFIKGLILAMEKINTFKPINIAYGNSIKIRDVLKHILDASKYKDANVKYDLKMPSMIPKRKIDISLANELLGWKPKISINDGIQRTVDWYKETSKRKIKNPYDY